MFRQFDTWIYANVRWRSRMEGKTLSIQQSIVGYIQSSIPGYIRCAKVRYFGASKRSIRYPLIYSTNILYMFGLRTGLWKREIVRATYSATWCCSAIRWKPTSSKDAAALEFLSRSPPFVFCWPPSPLHTLSATIFCHFFQTSGLIYTTASLTRRRNCCRCCAACLLLVLRRCVCRWRLFCWFWRLVLI